jgi:hypothetical protein
MDNQMQELKDLYEKLESNTRQLSTLEKLVETQNKLKESNIALFEKLPKSLPIPIPVRPVNPLRRQLDTKK